jgi:glycosyltransferase involved in cell wall biosynthesis
VDGRDHGPLVGLTYSKQFPNPAEPARGLFVAEQVRAAVGAVSWSVIAPVPRTSRLLARFLPRPFVPPRSAFDGLEVRHPAYHVLPRRLRYTHVGRSMAAASESDFASVVEHERPSFVHVHTLYPAGAAGRLLARRHGLPYVVTVHGSDLYSNITRPAWKAEIEPVVRDAAAVVCVSEPLARDTVALLGADPARTLVIPNTFDTGSFTVRETPLSAETLLSVGRLVDVKGHRVLIEALALLAPDRPDLRLRVVGEGPERDSLEALAARLGVADRVTFLGALDRERLAAEYRSADLFVLPSLREGFGVVLLESLASGTPVVATASGGPQGIVGPAEGELAEPGHADSLASAIGRALERIDSFDPAALSLGVHERYGPESVGKQLVTLYRDIAAGQRPGGALGVAETDSRSPQGGAGDE